VAPPALAQRDDEEFGALEDALHLERQELVAAPPQRVRGLEAFLVDQSVDPSAQPGVGDADEPQWLHQTDAGSGVRRLQQPGQNVVGHHRAAARWPGKRPAAPPC
jgi:hypothetical protein